MKVHDLIEDTRALGQSGNYVSILMYEDPDWREEFEDEEDFEELDWDAVSEDFQGFMEDAYEMRFKIEDHEEGLAIHIDLGDHDFSDFEDDLFNISEKFGNRLGFERIK